MLKLSHAQRVRTLLASCLLLTAPLLADDSEGVVRISDSQVSPASAQAEAQGVVVRGQSPSACVGNDCLPGGGGYRYGSGHGGGHGLFGHSYGTCPHCGQNVRWNSLRGQYVCGCNRFGGAGGGLFHHSEGPGYPLFGHYGIVYPVDPGYFDQRDGAVYGAPGYGGPVAVPLAPVVNYQMNYGWGVPSSRLTPISHPATPVPGMTYSSSPVARY